MKIVVTLKDPDGFYESVEEEVVKSLKSSGLPEHEQEALTDTRLQKAWEFLSTWVECQEYVTLEFDTEAGTATVKCN